VCYNNGNEKAFKDTKLEVDVRIESKEAAATTTAAKYEIAVLVTIKPKVASMHLTSSSCPMVVLGKVVTVQQQTFGLLFPKLCFSR